METHISEQDGRTLVAVTGRLDSTTGDSLLSSLEPVFLQKGVNLALDLGKLDYVSSWGLRTIQAILVRVNSVGGTMEITALSPSVRDVFEMTGFSRIFHIGEK